MSLLAAALAALALAGMPAPPVVPEVVEAPCPYPGYTERAGCTFGDGPIYALPEGGRATVLHELGHQFDIQAMHAPQRATFRVLTSDPSTEWWPTAERTCLVVATCAPAERFAEAYRLCASPRAVRRQAWTGAIVGRAGYTVAPRRHRRICLLIKRAGP